MTLLPIDVAPSDSSLLVPAPGNAIEPTGCIFRTLHDREVPGRPEADPVTDAQEAMTKARWVGQGRNSYRAALTPA
jgi:hypothetical protein